jgi:hypothetical protein
MRKWTKDDLYEYYKTDTWRVKSAERFTLDGHTCVLCGEAATVAHHRRYPEYLGFESVQFDLISLCQRCHHNYHFPPVLRDITKQVLYGEINPCPVCKQAVRKLNPHHMDLSKIKLLHRIAGVNAKGFPWVKIQQDENLIVEKERDWTIQTDAVHASRLKWFRLVDYYGHRSGKYCINEYGLDFLGGRASVPETIYCKQGEVQEESPEQVYIQEVRKVILDKEYWDDYHNIQTTLRDIRSQEDDDV